MASSIRFNSHVQAAAELKQQQAIFDGLTSKQVAAPLTWLAPLKQSGGELTLTDPTYHEIDFISHHDIYGDTGEILVADMIGAELDEDDQKLDAQPFEPSDLPGNAIDIIWHLPVSRTFPLSVHISINP